MNVVYFQVYCCPYCHNKIGTGFKENIISHIKGTPTTSGFKSSCPNRTKYEEIINNLRFAAGIATSSQIEYHPPFYLGNTDDDGKLDPKKVIKLF